MREILFRGKRVDNGEWVEGYYFKAKRHWNDIGVHEDWIADGAIQNGGWCNVVSKHAVIPTSISEYTGLTDKNGKRIFEGDIIIELDGGMDGIPRKVVWREEDVQYGCPLVRRHWAYGYNDCGFLMMQSENIEVIGNIHDNPELIGGDSDA